MGEEVDKLNSVITDTFKSVDLIVAWLWWKFIEEQKID
jgi:hypothetical protein